MKYRVSMQLALFFIAIFMNMSGCCEKTPTLLNSQTPPKCIPGKTIECACQDQTKGTQSCEKDGTYSDCTCIDEQKETSLEGPEGQLGKSKNKIMEFYNEVENPIECDRRSTIDTGLYCRTERRKLKEGIQAQRRLLFNKQDELISIVDILDIPRGAPVEALFDKIKKEESGRHGSPDKQTFHEDIEVHKWMSNDGFLREWTIIRNHSGSSNRIEKSISSSGKIIPLSDHIFSNPAQYWDFYEPTKRGSVAYDMGKGVFGFELGSELHMTKEDMSFRGVKYKVSESKFRGTDIKIKMDIGKGRGKINAKLVLYFNHLNMLTSITCEVEGERRHEEIKGFALYNEALYARHGPPMKKKDKSLDHYDAYSRVWIGAGMEVRIDYSAHKDKGKITSSRFSVKANLTPDNYIQY